MPTLPALTTAMPATVAPELHVRVAADDESASTPAKSGATRSSGVRSGEDRRRRCAASRGRRARCRRRPPRARLRRQAVEERDLLLASAGRAPSRARPAARCLAPPDRARGRRCRGPANAVAEPTSRSSVSLGNGPAARVAADDDRSRRRGTSASTASSAGRFPWTSYSAATCSVVDDLERHRRRSRAPPRARSSAARARCGPARPITLPTSSSATWSLEDERAVVPLDLPRRARRRARRRAAGPGGGRAQRPLGQLHGDGLILSPVLIYEVLRLEQPRDRVGRLRALREPVLHLLLVELDQRRLGLRVVAPDDLDELAVARRARVGGDDAVDRDSSSTRPASA